MRASGEEKLFGISAAPRAAHLSQAEKVATAPQAVATTEALRTAEDTATTTTPAAAKKPFLQRITARHLGKKGPLIAGIITLIGGGSLLYTILAPGFALSQLVETFTKDLNSSLAGMDRTHMQLMRTKLKQTTAGSCGKVKIACRFKTVNIEKTRSAYKTMGIEVEFDANEGFGKGRGRITKMTYKNPLKPGDVVTINSAEEFTDRMREHPHFRTAVINARSPKFLTLKNGPTMKFLAKIKTNYAKKLTGKTPKELDGELEKATSSKLQLGSKNLTPHKDENGNETGKMVDEDGKLYTPEEAAAIKDTKAKITAAPTSSSVVKNISKGVLITGAADTACSVYNASRAVSFAAKVARKAETIRYFMIFANTYSAMKKDDATPEQVEYLSKKITEVDLREKVADERKLSVLSSSDTLPMITNPNYRKSGLDAAFYKQSAYQDVPRLDISSQRFMAGGGLTGTLDSVNQTIASLLGTNSPKELTERCGIIQNPVVRGGSLVVGILVGLGSFGTSTAISIAGSAALAFAMPYLISQLGDIVAGRVTGPELAGVDAVNAIGVGASGMFNGVARQQGMIPLSPEKMVEYQNANRQVEVAYEADERRLASHEPFNVHNRFSFIGSLGRQLLPVHHTLQHTDGVRIIAALPTLFAQTGQAILPSAHALQSAKIKPERYQQCNDETYKEMNVAADSSCNLLFGLPKEAMDADPVEVAEWMAANGEIDPESDTGEPKDNEQEWNYKKFLEDCVNQEPGAHENPEESPDNGYACAAPENFEKNWRYAKYTVSKTWNDTLDGDTPGLDGTDSEGFGSGQQGEVSADGWAYPTTKDGIVTSPFGMRGGQPHNGLDIAQPGSALNKPIFAARDGKVIASGPASGFGNWIVIQHEVDGKRYDSVYGHMFDDGVFVKLGDSVKAGQEIGKIGNNGQSTGPHLHFEIWDGGHRNFGGGSAIDPAPIIRASHGGGA